MCHCSLNNPSNISILSLSSHVNCPPAAAASSHPSGSCPVRCSSPPPPELFQLLSLHIFALSRGAPATVDPAWPHTGPCIDAVQLFPNPALDFDPLPFFFFFFFKHTVPVDTSDLVVHRGHLVI